MEKNAPQIDSRAIFIQAESFALTCNILTRPDFSKHIVFTANPLIVLSAFASELFFKCLLLLEDQNIPKNEHGLKKLFEALPQDTQSRIIALWDANIENKKDQWAEAQKNESPRGRLDLPTALADGGNAFKILRYAHEGDVSLRFVLADLPYLLREVVLEKKPEWGNIGRRYRERASANFHSIETRTVGHVLGPEVDGN